MTALEEWAKEHEELYYGDWSPYSSAFFTLAQAILENSTNVEKQAENDAKNCKCGGNLDERRDEPDSGAGGSNPPASPPTPSEIADVMWNEYRSGTHTKCDGTCSTCVIQHQWPTLEMPGPLMFLITRALEIRDESIARLAAEGKLVVETGGSIPPGLYFNTEEPKQPEGLPEYVYATVVHHKRNPEQTYLSLNDYQSDVLNHVGPEEVLDDIYRIPTKYAQKMKVIEAEPARLEVE